MLLADCVTVIYQSRDEAKQQNQESQENRNQIEEDADRELLNMRIRHEQTVHEQQVKCHHVASVNQSSGKSVIGSKGTLSPFQVMDQSVSDLVVTVLQ